MKKYNMRVHLSVWTSALIVAAVGLLALATPVFAQDGGDLAVAGMGLTTILCIFAPVLAVYIAMILWVRKDAALRGQSGCLPIALVLVLGPLGMIIWLLMRPKDPV